VRQISAVIILLLCAVYGSQAFAATRYVSDELRITLRSGAGSQYKILDTLTTGTRVDVLATQGEKWARVRTPEGQEGWVLSQYLMDHPAAQDQLAAARKEVDSLQEKNDSLLQKLSDTQATLDQTQSTVQSLQGTKAELSGKLDKAQEGLQQYEETQKLKKQVVDLKRTIQELQTEKEQLADRTRHDWFLVGGGVMLTGMLLGIIVTRIRWRRRSTWGDHL